MKFSDNFVFKLKSSCDIYSVFSSYVELKPCGSTMRCCCPFHSEKTPSCFVYGSTQSFYCFGCGVGGDVITFIEKIENLPYVEAVIFLAKRVGVELPSQTSGEANESTETRRSRILQVNRVAALFFHKSLFSQKGEKALAYLMSRGVLKKTMVRFGLGYSLDSWSELLCHLKSKGFSEAEMVDSGLVLKSKSGNNLYDKFRGRIMFPIIGLRGEVLGFGGRTILGSGPKYLNSSDSDIFKKGLLLYGLNFVNKAHSEKKRDLILCEGYMDVVSLHQHGFSNAVATLGTALTKQQVLLISRNADEILIAYDSDKAGRIATARACDMFEQINFRVRVLNLKKAKDPDEFLKKYGGVRFKNLVSEAVSFERLLFENAKLDLKSATADEKRARIHKLCEVISKMADSLRRDIYISRVCTDFGLTKSVVVGHVNYLIKKNRQKNKAKMKSEMFGFVNASVGRSEMLGENLKLKKAQEGVIRALFKQPDLVKRLDCELKIEWFSSNFLSRVFSFLMDRLKSGYAVDFSSFREVLSESELGVLSRILNEDENLGGVSNSLSDYIEILSSEFLKDGEDVLKMSLAELELKRQKKAKLKF